VTARDSSEENVRLVQVNMNTMPDFWYGSVISIYRNIG
jgi:hypothetical protein